MWPRIPNLFPVFIALSSFVKFDAVCEKHEWDKLNDILKNKLEAVIYHLNRVNNPEDVSRLGDQANVIIKEFLEEHPEAFEVADTNKKSKFIKHSSKTLAEAIELKKTLKKKAQGKDATENDFRHFRAALKAVSDLRKAERKRELMKTSHHQEEMFFKNKWEFSKKATQGTLDKVPENPSFSKADADIFYPETYSQAKTVDLSQLNWFPNLPTDPTNENFKEFSLDPIRPKDVKNTLKNCNKNSSPGPDGISYKILLKLPVTHHLLATLYNKVLEYGSPLVDGQNL